MDLNIVCPLLEKSGSQLKSADSKQKRARQGYPI